jgi:integrase
LLIEILGVRYTIRKGTYAYAGEDEVNAAVQRGSEETPIRFHDLRHSCLSLLAQRGEPIRDLQALAGHATAAFTLQRYTHHYDSSARRTAGAMSEILPDEPSDGH